MWATTKPKRTSPVRAITIFRPSEDRRKACVRFIHSPFAVGRGVAGGARPASATILSKTARGTRSGAGGGDGREDRGGRAARGRAEELAQEHALEGRLLV